MQYTLKKFLSFLPPLLVMIMIFCFSAQPADDSSSLSESVACQAVRIYQHITHTQLSEDMVLSAAEKIHGFIRKLAHAAEYFILAFAFTCFFYINGYSFKKQILFTFCFCAIYAVTDEFHQYFVPGRSCQLRDVCIDSLGASLFLFLRYLIFLTVHKFKKLFTE